MNTPTFKRSMRLPRFLRTHINIPGIARWALGLLAIFSACVGGIRLAIGSSNQYACMYFVYAPPSGYGQRQSTVLVDIRTKAALMPYHVMFSAIPVQYFVPPMSPDGRQGLYLLTTPSNPKVQIYLYQKGSAQPILLQDKVDVLQTISWSPDSTKLAFLWLSGNFYSVSVVNVDGSNYRIVFQSTVPPNLGSWSADNQYLVMAVQNAQNYFIQFWSVPDQRLIFGDRHYLIFEGGSGVGDWSPIGHRLAYHWADGGAQFVSIVSPDNLTETTLQWNKGGGTERNVWSPDGRYLVLFSSPPQSTGWRAEVYRADPPGIVPLVSDIDTGSLPLEDANPQWLNNGQAFALLRGGVTFTADLTTVSLETYHLDTGIHDSLDLGTVSVFPQSSQPGQFVAFRQRNDDKQALDILNYQTGALRTVIADADDMGNPYWSPDNQWLAVVWATGQGSGRVVKLTWMHADGSERHDLTENFWDVQNLSWSQDGRSLIFETWRADGYGVEAVDLETGIRHTLAGGLVQVLNLMQDTDSGLITFWWRTGDDSIGVSAYEVSGRQRFQFRGQGAGEPILTAGLFWAPDHRKAALKVRFKDEETLQLAEPDGAPSRMVRDGLSGLGDPLWSPDSKMLAFTQSINAGPITLELTTATGDDLQQFSYPRQLYWNLSWSRCS